MRKLHFPSNRSGGFTLIEVGISVAVMSVFVVSVITAISGSQTMVVKDHAISRVRLRSQNALERILHYAGQAVTADPMFAPFEDDSGVNSHGLRFRLIDQVTTGGTLYDDTQRVYIYGGTTADNTGLVILRGPDYATIFSQVAGPDQLLGTTDDVSDYSYGGGIPALELLLTSDHRPSSGDMLSINISPAPVGRTVVFTLRVNARDRQGNFIFDNDIVLTQTVVLRQ